MFWRLLGGQRIFSVQWLETSWKFPTLGLAAQEKTHNLSIRCQGLPLHPQPADPSRPLRGSVLPAALWVHRYIELPCSPWPDCLNRDLPWRWPVTPWLFSVGGGVGSACLSWTAGAFRKDDNVKVCSSEEANIKCSSHAKLQVFNEWLRIKEAISCHISALLSLSQHWCWLLFRKPLHLTLLGFLGRARSAMPRSWLLLKRYYRTKGNAEKQV